MNSELGASRYSTLPIHGGDVCLTNSKLVAMSICPSLRMEPVVRRTQAVVVSDFEGVLYNQCFCFAFQLIWRLKSCPWVTIQCNR